MERSGFERRDFLKYVLGGVGMLALDWGSLPRAVRSFTRDESAYDAVIIGSGLGGLSCAAGFARQGFKVLVLEQHDKPGGYATAFQRPGGFTFDVSLHSTTVGERNGLHNMIPGFPEITDVEFVPHPNLYRVIYPDYDIRVPQKNLDGYIKILIDYFPEEKEGIVGLFHDMEELAKDIGKLSDARGKVDMSNFSTNFPYLFKYYNKTWKDMLDARLKNPKLRAIVSAQWGYYGLPPSKLVSFYYALPAIGYLTAGGYYPKGRSQTISDALVKFIESHGGKVMSNSRVEKILLKDHAARGVKIHSGEEFASRVVVSNANPFDTLGKMTDDLAYLSTYLEQLNHYSVSLSCIQIFLGLKEDLVGKLGIKDSEIFYQTGYDPEAEYEGALKSDFSNPGFGLSLYDNIFDGYSPAGKNTVDILTLSDYEHWRPYEADYFAGNKDAYKKEKERIANILIERVEKTLLPGLVDAIEVKEIGTPLTNIRYTSNYHGAIYGLDQTVDDSGQSRLPHHTPISNLYLSGAWTKPGHGYGAVLSSGLECFREIMQTW
jgi:phytoene dehydrogenase-like protein